MKALDNLENYVIPAGFHLTAEQEEQFASDLKEIVYALIPLRGARLTRVVISILISDTHRTFRTPSPSQTFLLIPTRLSKHTHYSSANTSGTTTFSSQPFSTSCGQNNGVLASWSSTLKRIRYNGMVRVTPSKMAYTRYKRL